MGCLPKFESSNKQPSSTPQHASELRTFAHDPTLLQTHCIADSTTDTIRCTPKYPNDDTQPVNQQSPLILYRHCNRPWLKNGFGLILTSPPQKSTPFHVPTEDGNRRSLRNFVKFVDAFAKLPQATNSFVMSVCPHGTTWFPLYEFSWNFIFLENLSKKLFKFH